MSNGDLGAVYIDAALSNYCDSLLHSVTPQALRNGGERLSRTDYVKRPEHENLEACYDHLKRPEHKGP